MSETVTGEEPLPGPTLPGIDLSMYVKDVQWKSVIDSGRAAFAFLECARGPTISQRFAADWRDAGMVGVRRGAYQRIFTTASIEAQVNAVIEVFDASGIELAEADLPLVLDVEYDDDNGTQQTAMLPAEFLASMATWVRAIRSHFGRTPIIYTNPNFWREYLDNAKEFGEIPLWIAHSSVKEPDIPGAWTTYAFWQYHQEATFPGVDGHADLDVFSGSEEDLDTLVSASLLPLDL